MREKVMPFLHSAEEKQKKILIITSSGGGGLIQAANAKEQEVKAQDPNVIILRRDVLRDWSGKWFGEFCCNLWNRAQSNGNVKVLRILLEVQFIFDYFSWPNFFFRSLSILFKEDVDRIIDTQPIGTSAILKAIRIYNWKKGKQLMLEKVLVDLPTKKATHFLRPIKWLGRSDRSVLKLTTIAPLLEEGETSEDFWKKNCRLSESEVHYEDVYVRQSFRRLQNKPRSTDSISLFIRYKSDEELNLIRKAYGKGLLTGEAKEGKLYFSIPPQARLITILLGSQPASDATLNYVKKFAHIARESTTPKIPIYLFVFCADHQVGQISLLRRVSEYMVRMKDHPKNLSVIPFSFQNDDVIASLFHRSDLSCTRSGGQTAMELMCVSSGDIWIHSEAKKEGTQMRELSIEELLRGIPGWEAANACYLQKLWNAKIVTPEIFAPLARRFFRSSDGSTVPMRDCESIA